jgi:DNA repair protein RecN (Recombination protein N)
MLDELSVANLGLIADAHIEPGDGLVVVTGETGTGKTLLLGAIRLLIGEQARRDQVGPHGEEAKVDGRFVDGDVEVIASRRVTASGRSKAYLDGSMVAVKALQDALGGAVELVAQHDALTLRSAGQVRRLLDGRLTPEGMLARAEYEAAWIAASELRRRQKLLGGDARALTRELEMLEFQAVEIGEAGFAPGDDQALAALADRLRNATGIVEQLGVARQAIEDGVLDGLGAAADALLRAARLDPALASLAERLDALVAELSDVSIDLARSADEIETGDASLDEVERRVSLLGDLKRRYGDSLDAVLAYATQAEQRADELRELLGQAESIADDLVKADIRVRDAAGALTAARRACAAETERAAERHLRDLGFATPVVRFAITEAEPSPEGADHVELRFASDAALSPGPVSAVASGGEVSRLVLALRLAAGVADAPTIAFDEIDAGVGGATALALGEKLAALAIGRQVLCVTHLPQVAAFGNSHYVVDRSGTAATIRQVSGEARVEELSRMLAGLPDSDRGREHAAELLERAAGRRASGEIPGLGEAGAIIPSSEVEKTR